MVGLKTSFFHVLLSLRKCCKEDKMQEQKLLVDVYPKVAGKLFTRDNRVCLAVHKG